MIFSIQAICSSSPLSTRAAGSLAPAIATDPRLVWNGNLMHFPQVSVNAPGILKIRGLDLGWILSGVQWTKIEDLHRICSRQVTCCSLLCFLPTSQSIAGTFGLMERNSVTWTERCNWVSRMVKGQLALPTPGTPWAFCLTGAGLLCHFCSEAFYCIVL